jgi:ABC-type Fe2+-enterobactin transport system substrate-binding protein
MLGASSKSRYPTCNMLQKNLEADGFATKQEGNWDERFSRARGSLRQNPQPHRSLLLPATHRVI